MFVKSPVPGDVKTRLIPFLTGSEAADLYKCFVSDILANLFHKTQSAKMHLAYQPHSKANDLSWLESKNTPELYRQEGRSLGERLVHSFGVAFGKGFQRIVIIGSDSPTLPHAYIEQAFSALQDSDVVLGPAMDGGYYLIGLSRPCLKLFEDVSWSTDQIFERTARNAESLGYSLRVLPSHYDIDTIDDLMRLHEELNADGHQAPLTKKYLSQLLKTKTAFSRS